MEVKVITVVDKVNEYLALLGQPLITDLEIRQLEYMGFHLLAPNTEYPCEAVVCLQIILYVRGSEDDCFSYNKAMLGVILNKTGCPFVPNPFPKSELGFFIGVGV